MSKRAIWMLLGVALLVIIPLLRGGEFGGADGEAAALIEGIEGFTPWASPLWEPPSGEIESLFFSLQAALGALVIGYAIGRAHGRRERQGGQKDDAPPPSA